MDLPTAARSLPPAWRWVLGIAVVVLVAFLSFAFSSYLSTKVSPVARGPVKVQVRPLRVETGEAVLVRWSRRYFQYDTVRLALCGGRRFLKCTTNFDTPNDGRETFPITVGPGTYVIRVSSFAGQSARSNRFRVVPEEPDDGDGGGGGGNGGGGGGGAPLPPPPPPPPYAH